MATVTTYAHVPSVAGYKVLICGVTGIANYVAGGDSITAGTTVNGINSIVTIIPSPANGYVPWWDNTAGKMLYMVHSNNATNQLPLIEVNAVVNFSKVTFPAIIVGTSQ